MARDKHIIRNREECMYIHYVKPEMQYGIRWILPRVSSLPVCCVWDVRCMLGKGNVLNQEWQQCGPQLPQIVNNNNQRT